MFKFAVLALGLVCSAAGNDQVAWQKLQRGMNQAQVERIVGVPLLRNAARGHELWIYDAGANAQFHGGALSAWTAPASAARPASAKLPPKSSAKRGESAAAARAS